MEGIEIIAIGLYVVIKAFVSYVCFRKGKPVFGALGLISIPIPLFIGWFAVVGAIRLAKPSSSWASDRYDQRKMAAARLRFPDEGEATAQSAKGSWDLEPAAVTSGSRQVSPARTSQALARNDSDRGVRESAAKALSDLKGEKRTSGEEVPSEADFDRMATSGRGSTRIRAASDENAPPSALATLARDPWNEVRLAVAQNKGAPMELLDDLKHDGHKTVALEAGLAIERRLAESEQDDETDDLGTGSMKPSTEDSQDPDNGLGREQVPTPQFDMNGSGQLVENLERLATLVEAGHLTSDEFEVLKARLIGR